MISLKLVSDSEAALIPAERDLGPDELSVVRFVSHCKHTHQREIPLQILAFDLYLANSCLFLELEGHNHET